MRREIDECFPFRAPPEYAKYLAAAGFTMMSNAKSHSFDFGQAGEDETTAALHRVGASQTGLPGETTIVKADGRKVAFLGFAPYSNTASLTDLATAREMIRQARKLADIVVVAIHAGAEGSDAQHVIGDEETCLGKDRGSAEEFAHITIEAGADLILGSGPQVLRGIEIYRGRLVSYGLGNFSGLHNFVPRGCSARRWCCASPWPRTAPSAPVAWPRSAWSKRANRPRPGRRRQPDRGARR